MPRKVRQLCDGGIYHVFNRGNDRRQLFADPDDFKAFLSRVLDLKLELSVEVIHYCLMNNHFHFLLRVVNGQDLIKFMHRLQLGYVQYFKKKYSFVGHVFQERFRSPLINGESYYLQCGRYIERNPVKAGVVKLAWEYKLGNRSALEWILDQYKESKPKDPTIAEKFNTYHFAEYKEQVIDLLKRVCTVSVETMKIVNSMPE